MNISATTFLNVDLDIGTEDRLEELLEYFGRSVLVIHREGEEATLELREPHQSVEETLCKLIELIRTLPPQAKALWQQCHFRRMNIGIQAGQEPHEVRFSISDNTISSLAELDCEVVFSVYAPRM